MTNILKKLLGFIRRYILKKSKHIRCSYCGKYLKLDNKKILNNDTLDNVTVEYFIESSNFHVYVYATEGDYFKTSTELCKDCYKTLSYDDVIRHEMKGYNDISNKYLTEQGYRKIVISELHKNRPLLRKEYINDILK